MGSTSFGLQCLEAIQKNSLIEIVGVLTAKRQFAISYAPTGVENVNHADYSKISQALNCPLLCLEAKMSDPSLLSSIEELKADAVLVAGWHHMVPQAWLQRWPTYGLHASLLPKYSGGAPLVWAMINGEKWTGVTLFKFSEGVDTGPVVSQKRVRIRRGDNIASLYQRITRVSIEILNSELPNISVGTQELKNQNEKKRTIFRQRNPEDGRLPQRLNSKQTRNFVRAQTKPYPGAFIEFGQYRLTMWRLGSIRPALRQIPDELPFRVRGGRVFLRCKMSWISVEDFSLGVVLEDSTNEFESDQTMKILQSITSANETM